jgi:para-aminobenzoate synthetase component 1
MLKADNYQPESPEEFKKKALYWASSFDTACYFDSNNFQDPYSAFDVLIAAGAVRFLKCNAGTAFDQLDHFLKFNPAILPGFLAYDLKNEIESLSSENPDRLGFPDLYFFEPLHLILIKNGQVTISSSEQDDILEQIINTPLKPTNVGFRGSISSRFGKTEYIRTVNELKNHIHRGDIYEANLCQEFYANDCHLNPEDAFLELNRISPTPFSNYFKLGSKYILSATPERFLNRQGNKLISQPIKGTVKRHADATLDQIAKDELRKNEKELAENVMIVDLVRNDLTRSAIPGTVKVEELFGIYSFKQVHQMISTVVCEVDHRFSNAEILKNTFPMGSMTGAPKISAMKLIEMLEKSRRGVYSGAVGYFSGTGDFDFNVVIRSILYNAENGYLSFQVGSAITADADAEKEYEECLLKAEAIFELLVASC